MTQFKICEHWLGAVVGVGMAVGVLGMSGCLISSSSRTEHSGSYVSYTALSKLKKGESTEQYVLATFGPPTGKAVEADGSEVWEYRWDEVKERDTSVFLVLSTESSSRREGAAFVKIHEGIVVDFWRK